MKLFYSTIYIFASLVFFKCNAQSVFINELMASNSHSYTDQDGQDSDWVELYNAGSSTVDLGGYYVSDDPGELKKIRLPSGTGEYVIASGAFLILWASGTADLPRHLNFNLSGDGEQFILVAPSAIIIDQITFAKQRVDISYGRKANGGTELELY